jgi:hypothetical protein
MDYFVNFVTIIRIVQLLFMLCVLLVFLFIDYFVLPQKSQPIFDDTTLSELLNRNLKCIEEEIITNIDSLFFLHINSSKRVTKATLFKDALPRLSLFLSTDPLIRFSEVEILRPNFELLYKCGGADNYLTEVFLFEISRDSIASTKEKEELEIEVEGTKTITKERHFSLEACDSFYLRNTTNKKFLVLILTKDREVKTFLDDFANAFLPKIEVNTRVTINPLIIPEEENKENK